ncbi:MAG: VWA domain-containing protein [Myxococcales bacterium]|nr:VWA domain-containing protein [Myxococcales bacterium]
MDLLGLPATQLGPLGAAVGGAVVGLYLLKLRRRRVAVPYARLWERVVKEQPSASLFARLKRLISLLIQLAVVAALVLALGDPRPTGAARAGRNMVVLVDASASMKALDEPGGRIEAARRAVRRLVQQMGPADRMLVAQFDAEVTALAPMTDDVEALDDAASRLTAHDTRGALGRALAFAHDALGELPNPEVILISDGAYDAATLGALGAGHEGHPLRFVGVGRRGRNVAVSAFAVRRYPLDKSRYEVFVEVTSYSAQRENFSLRLAVDGTPLESVRLTLEPGASVRRTLENQTGANQSLEARIVFADGQQDDLAVDDVAWATLPPRRRARVLAVSENNRYLEAALLLDDYLEVTEARRETLASALANGRFDAAVVDLETAPLPPTLPALYLRPGPENSPLARAPALVNAPPGSALGFEQIQRAHPLLRYTSDLEEAHIGRMARYTPGPGDRVLATSLGAPLLVAGQRAEARFAVLAFDVRESDFALLVSWPVLVLNAIDWFAGEDPAYLSSFETGQTWRVPVLEGVAMAAVTSPSGQSIRAPVIDGRAVFFGYEAGLYRVTAGRQTVLVAGNLREPRESQCQPAATLTLGGRRLSAPVPGALGLRRELWRSLLIAVLVVLLAEWATWHRRVTV